MNTVYDQCGSHPDWVSLLLFVKLSTRIDVTRSFDPNPNIGWIPILLQRGYADSCYAVTPYDVSRFTNNRPPIWREMLCLCDFEIT